MASTGDGRAEPPASPPVDSVQNPEGQRVESQHGSTASGPPVGLTHRAKEPEAAVASSPPVESARSRQTKALVRTAVIATFAMTLQSRFIAVAQATLLRRLLNNDAAATASKLAVMTTVSSLASFVANPALGQASDVYGRKFFMLLSPAMILIARLSVLVYPSVETIWLSRYLISIFNQSFNNATQAAIADIMGDSPTELATVFSKVQYVSKGVATIIGPTISGLIVNYSWRISYMISSVLCAVNLFVCVPRLVSRIPPPKPGAVFSFKAANPFSFMSLFNPSSDYNACPTSDSGKKGDMAKLALVCGMQQGTTSGMSDPQFPLIAGRLGWGSGKMGLYQSAQGVANVVSGYLTGPVLRRTGRVRITYLGNLLQTLSYVGTGLAGSGYTMIGALALRAPVNENSAVQAMLVAQAKRLNIGQGRLAADVANFSAVTKAITPILYGWAAQYSVRYPFFMAALMFTIANAIFSLVPHADAATPLTATNSWANIARSQNFNNPGVHGRILKRLGSLSIIKRLSSQNLFSKSAERLSERFSPTKSRSRSPTTSPGLAGPQAAAQGPPDNS